MSQKTLDYIALQIERLDAIILDAQDNCQDPILVEKFMDDREVLISEQLQRIKYNGFMVV